MKTQTPTAPETAPKRSPARLTLAARHAARTKAQEAVSARQADARRLAILGEAAKALANQLAGAKARDAAILAEHVVSGATGGIPKLASQERGDLVARLAEAEAQAEAAVPALAIVEGKITDALAEHNRTCAAVGLAVRPVVEEEIASLMEETKAAMARLQPLTQRLAGARAFAYTQADASQSGEDEKRAFLMLGNSLDQALATLGIKPHMAGHTSEGTWSAFSHRLIADADAQVVA